MVEGDDKLTGFLLDNIKFIQSLRVFWREARLANISFFAERKKMKKLEKSSIIL